LLGYFLQNIAPPEGAIPNDKVCPALGTEPLGSAFGVFLKWRIDNKHIKFMLNAFKGKIDTHKAVVMIFDDKADHLTNTFAMIIFVRIFFTKQCPA
jgi:hypothetical protein